MGNLDSLVYHGHEYDENYSMGITLQWHLTVACDQKCKHCYMFNDSTYISQRDNQLTTVQAYKLIDEFAGLLRKLKTTGTINLTVGDPLLSNNFWNVLQYIPNHSDVLNIGAIMGNSYHVDDTIAGKLKMFNISQYQISLYGMEDTHDYIRKPGSFKDALRALKCLHDTGIGATVMATVNKYNCGEILELYKYLSEIEYIDSFRFDRMIPIGNAIKELSKEIVDTEEYRNLMLQLFQYEITESPRKILAYKDSLWKPLFYEMGLSNPLGAKNKNYRYACPAGGSHFCVLSDGTIYACRRLEIKAGKYPDESLESIFYNSSLFNNLRLYSYDDNCAECKLQHYCYGCPAMKYSINGTINGQDPNCWHNMCVGC